MTGPRLTIAEINAMSAEAFLAALGAVFEHSPWIAERAFRARPFADRAALHRAMTAVVEAAGPDEQLGLIRAHPDLAGKAARAGAITVESVSEQAAAGLDRLSEAEFERFGRLNSRYQDRFAIPFIIAVRDHDKHAILAAFEARLGHDAEAERAEAVRQILRITELRLADLIGDGQAVKS